MVVLKKNAGLRITEKLQLAETRTGWFYPKNLTDDIAIALANEAIERAQAVEIYYDGKYVKTESYRQRVDNDVAAAIDDCIFYAQLYEKRHMSSSSYSSSSSSISSSSAEESSSSESSSSSKQSSSSLSSSSEPESSSSEPESSSSVLEESSSSYVEAETFVPGGDQVYTPDQVFNDGLQNMEDGKCYSLNPDRGTVYGWDLSLNAQDPWWWREIDCNTGKKPVKAGIGVCAAYPDTVPKNETACYAYNGSCYVCDNSRDYVDCSQSWLWMYNFPGHDWFKKVDCNDPYEEEEECLDDGLFKMQASSEDDAEFESAYSVNLSVPVKYYDLLGRNTNKPQKYRNRMLVGVRNKPTNVFSQQDHFVFYIPVSQLAAQTTNKCGELGYDFGVKNGSDYDLGIYCGHPYYEYKEDSVRVDISKDMFGRKCDNGEDRYEAVARFPIKLSLEGNFYKVVDPTFKYNGSVIRDSLRDSIARHEFGHKYYTEHCWRDTVHSQDAMIVIDSLCASKMECGRDLAWEKLQESVRKAVIDRIRKKGDEYADSSAGVIYKLCGWYHGKYSTSDGPSDTTNTSSLTCPDLRDPDIKYDYLGCKKKVVEFFELWCVFSNFVLD